MPSIGILGAGRHAAEVQSYCEDEIVFQAVQKEYVGTDSIDIEVASQEQLATPVVAAVGAPSVRRALVELWKGNVHASVVSKSAYVDKSAHIGDGSQIAPMAVLMPGVELGKHCVVNVHASISHDCTLGDYATVSPGAHIGGKVKIGAGAFIGIGATVRDGVYIAEGAVIGAGAVLIHDAQEQNGVYVGNPARHIKTNEDWLHDF
jgi:sugar O-acyltransferase (sialic acid O-acetyltransferase NeuD family)